jgi:hypothetical protein
MHRLQIKIKSTFLYKKRYIFLLVLPGSLLFLLATTYSMSAKQVVCATGNLPKDFSENFRDVELKKLKIIIKLSDWEKAVLLNNGSIEIMSNSTFNYYQCVNNAKKNGLRVIGGISPTTDNYKLVTENQKDILKQIFSEYSDSSIPSIESFDWYGKSAVIVYSQNDRFGSRAIGIVIPLNDKHLVITPSYQRPLEGERGVYALLKKIRPLTILQ